jgi:hypothetical protein
VYNVSMKVFVTKHALTQGILLVEVEGEPTIGGMVVSMPEPGAFKDYFHGEGKDWHRTFDAARQRAEQMRITKIASLRKSIAKFEKLTF